MRLLVTLPWGQRLGGAEAMIQTVLDGAHETAHELELVFCQQGPWPAELRAAGFRVQTVPAGRLRRADRWPATVARLARIMRARQPDLILNWSAKTQLFGAPAAALAGMADRVLWWQHNIPERHWLDRCATALPAIAVGCSSQACARAQARLSARRQTFVVMPGARSPSAHAQTSRVEGPASAAFAPASAAFAPASVAFAQPPGIPVVGLVGRLEPWKGHDRLLRAQALLRERGHRIHLLLVGGDAYDISPSYARSLPALIQELGLDGAVTLTGQVADAGPYIERMDVLVNASEGEPFGIVMLEGMARGVPVVAVAQGGPAEVIDHERTGLLARSGEPAALADALEPLLSSAGLRQRIGHAGRERFARDFTDAAMRTRFFAELEALRRDRLATAGGRG
jgi:glycosyltransferase involved in cell wall biosynthesis